ncbi:hypothetical protein pb186bvf_008330 [Paramecium bursaria]
MIKIDQKYIVYHLQNMKCKEFSHYQGKIIIMIFMTVQQN